jgi:hypothetical protein
LVKILLEKVRSIQVLSYATMAFYPKSSVM